MTKPKIHLPNGTSVLLYNSPKQSVNTDMDDDALDYAIKYTSYDGQRKELMVSWERESNEIVIEDFHLQDRDAETFYFGYMPTRDVVGDDRVQHEEDFVPLLKLWLCIPKNTNFNHIFHEARIHYFEEKELLALRKREEHIKRVQEHEEHLEKLARFMAAASIDRNYANEEHPLLRITKNPDLSATLMTSIAGPHPDDL